MSKVLYKFHKAKYNCVILVPTVTITKRSSTPAIRRYNCQKAHNQVDLVSKPNAFWRFSQRNKISSHLISCYSHPNVYFRAPKSTWSVFARVTGLNDSVEKTAMSTWPTLTLTCQRYGDTCNKRSRALDTVQRAYFQLNAVNYTR